MLYKFRWLAAVAAGIIIVMLGAWLDLLPRHRALRFAQQNAYMFKTKVAALPAAPFSPSSLQVKNTHFLLPDVAKVAAMHTITINSITQAANNQVHFVARGNYNNLLLFLAELLTKHAAVLSNFTYQAIGNNELRLVADASFSSVSRLRTERSGAASAPNYQSLLFMRNPFCGQVGGNTVFNMHANANSISLDLQNNNLSDTLRLLAKLLNRNVMVSPAVEGMVTLHVQHAKPSAVFALLLDSYGLETLKRDNVWYVAPRDELIKRKQQEMKWQTVTTETAELVTETLQIHYAKAADIARILQEGKATFLSVRGQVRVDVRTNIICVQDVPERMSAIRLLIKKLDQPSQQVRIEARLASVDEDFEKELGVDFSVQANVANAVPGRYSVAIAHLPDGTKLDVRLAALETQGHAELISSPSLYTANQQPAAIEAGEEVPYQEVSESGGTAVVFKKAVLGLKVTPQVLPGGYVLLQLRINQDRPSNHLVLGMPTISTRQILTNVLVKSGQTAVLGGIYENQDEKAVQRIPLLSSVPLVGELFTLRNTRHSKRELLIFVTPKIMTQTP